MKKHVALVGMLLVLFAVVGLFLTHRDGISECPAKPRVGEWYQITPEAAQSSDGSQWSGRIRLGRENKVMVYLLGGGVSLDAYSAAQSYTAAGDAAFYYDRDDGVTDARLKNGVGSDDARNPFRDWTMVVIPYTTADFHAGAGEAAYAAGDGSGKQIYHHGYSNCMALLEAAKGLVGNPEALLITGYSAGGFGAAMLAEDVIAHFPDTENVTVCVDGALLINAKWADVARDRWHAPERIVQRMTTGNLSLDHLTALHESHGDVKILFTCSTRDGGLAKYQSYIDGNAYAASEAYGDVMEDNLRKTVEALQAQVPGCGIYIWDDLPYGDSGTLTKHTILTNSAMFEEMQGASIGEWIYNAVEGRVESHGLELLQK